MGYSRAEGLGFRGLGLSGLYMHRGILWAL